MRNVDPYTAGGGLLPGAWLDCSPRERFQRAEAELARLRQEPPDMDRTVAQALADALAGNPLPSPMALAGRLVAAAVTIHAASFQPGDEPAYHGQMHQAEAARAMGWLCGVARRLELLTDQQAACGVLAMAGHDLLHDGSRPAPGVLERLSADATEILTEHAGLDAAAIGTVRRVILATDPLRTPQARAADDLLCRMAEEADLFASMMPEHGWRLGMDLAREFRLAQFQLSPPCDSYSARLRLLRGMRPETPAGAAFALAEIRREQIAAMAEFGQGDAEQGAAALDAMSPEESRTAYRLALAAQRAAC